MKLKNKGQNLTHEDLKEISENFVITKHAQKRLQERGLHESEIKEIILSPYKAFFNTDYSINIAKDSSHYLVFVFSESSKKFVLITYKEPSKNKVSIDRKQMLAFLKLGRLKSNVSKGSKRV